MIALLMKIDLKRASEVEFWVVLIFSFCGLIGNIFKFILN